MKYFALALLAFVPTLLIATPLAVVKDKHVAQVITYMEVLADSTTTGESYPVRIIDIRAELGEC